ncbi:MAG: HD domain-containing protein [bacterium]
MNFENNKTYNLFVRVDSANKNNKIVNLSVTLSDESNINIKVNEEQFKSITLGEVYYVDVLCKDNGTRKQLLVSDFKLALDLDLSEELEKALRTFYSVAPVSICSIKKQVEKYLYNIKNKILKDISLALYKEHERKFSIYPAGTKMHHAYLGGLLYHTHSMLELCDGYLKVYPTLNSDYLSAGIILHDIMKVKEFVGPNVVEYSIEGQLVGHIVMSTIEVEKKAIELGYENTEEVLILKHLLLSHHGQLAYGSPKKPMTKEAVLISSLDSIDSKLRVLEEELEKTVEGSFTNNIMVLERGKFYKTKK